MTKNKRISRRDVNKRLGLAIGSSLIGANIANAAIPTPEQVEGPFHPVVNQPDTDIDLVMVKGRTEPAQGDVILVRGRILDTHGQPIRGALVDIWQANHVGRYSHAKDPNPALLDPNFQGWGMVSTDDEGRYGFKTIIPGAYPLSFLGDEGWRCRHIHFQVSRDGFKKLTTQMYFHGDPLIEQDLEIAKVAEEDRHLLIARPEQDVASALPLYPFDILMSQDS